MEGDPKEWLNEQFLKLALSEDVKDSNIIVNNYTVKPAVESGNNYCTQLYRVKVDYIKDNQNMLKSLIIKAPLPEGSSLKALIDEAKLIKNEYIMYTEILPEAYTICEHEFGPRTYFCEEKDILIMDDLTEEGYTMSDRLQQLDLHHCKQFLATLAKYHAVTVALHKQNPELIESNGVHPFYNETLKNQVIMFFETIKRNTFVKILQQLNGMETLAATIESCADNLNSRLTELFKRRGSINVLNHGDCWTNNIMFKYDKGGSVSDCKLIDFQIRTYGSPAIDLLYFLFTSARPEVRQNHMEDMLNVYCDNLNENLLKFDCDERLSVQDLQEELKDFCPWALNVVINYLPMILNEPDELRDKLKENEENFKNPDINVNPSLRVFLSKTYNAVLPSVCEDLIKLEVIGHLQNVNS